MAIATPDLFAHCPANKRTAETALFFKALAAISSGEIKLAEVRS
jgi:hypothetical protein